MSLLPYGGINIILDDSLIIAHDHDGTININLGNSMHATANAATLGQILALLHGKDQCIMSLCNKIYEYEIHIS